MTVFREANILFQNRSGRVLARSLVYP